MAFVPPSSLASAVISGSVSVSNFPATQPVSGTVALDAPTLAALEVIGLDAATLAALENVSVDNFPASVAVTGPLTNAQLRASAVAVDGSGVTQPISVDELPLPDGAADNETLSEVALTAILERERMALT